MGDQDRIGLKSFVTNQRQIVCKVSNYAIRFPALKKASDPIFDSRCQKEARGPLCVGRNNARTPGFEIPNVNRFTFIVRPKCGHMHMYIDSFVG